MLEIFKQLKKVTTRRYKIIRELYISYKSMSYSIGNLRNTLLEEEIDPEIAGYIIQYLSVVLCGLEEHKDFLPRFFSTLKKKFSCHSAIERAILFYYAINDKKSLIQYNSPQNLTSLKSQFVILDIEKKDCFKVPSPLSLDRRRIISFSNVEDYFVNNCDMESFLKYEKFLRAVYDFPFLNNIEILTSWINIDNKKLLDLIINSQIFLHDDKYIIYDPIERAKVERYLKNNNEHLNLKKRIEIAIKEKRRDLCYKKTVENFFELGTYLPNSAIIIYGYTGHFSFNKKAQDLNFFEKETMLLEKIYLFKHYNQKKFKITINDKSFSLSINTLTVDDIKIGHILVAEDITQKELFQKFSRHDIKNNLLSLHTDFELLQDEDIFSKEERHKVLKAGKKSIQDLRDKIDNVLAFGDDDLQLVENENISLLINDVTVELNGALKAKEIILSLAVEEDLLWNCDKPKIKRIIENLLHNAIEYAPQQSKVEIQAFKNKHELTIKILDQGPGISKEIVGDSIFTPGITSGTSSNNWGIGLAIVKKFSELHNGFVKYENNHPKGTIFIVTLRK